MARVRPQVAALVLGATLVVSAGAGYAWNRVTREPIDSARVDTPGVYTEPAGIAVAPSLDGKPLPTVALESLDGLTLTTGDLVGRPMVINLWFSTCAPCAQELPEFAEVHRELGDRVRFVGIDHFDTAAKAEAFARDKGVEYELYLDPDAALVTGLRIGVFPTTLLVAPDGTIVDLRSGAMTADELRAAISTELPA
jgi:thiol-disulfide isomerase/thioredoxin